MLGQWRGATKSFKCEINSSPGFLPRRKFRRSQPVAGEVALVQASEFGLGHFGETFPVVRVRQFLCLAPGPKTFQTTSTILR